MLELYNALTNAQKHTIRRKYIYLFGNDRVLPIHTQRTFHRKIKGEVGLNRAELIFFGKFGLVIHPNLHITMEIPPIQIDIEIE